MKNDNTKEFVKYVEYNDGKDIRNIAHDSNYIYWNIKTNQD